MVEVHAVPSGCPASEAGIGDDVDDDLGPAELTCSVPALDAPPPMCTVLVPASQHGQRLDKLVVPLAPQHSRSHLQSLITGGHARVEGVVRDDPAYRVKAGQRIELVLMPTAESLAFRPEPMTLAVAYEDEHLLVIDKPAGLVVHPAAGHWSGTVLNGLLAHHVDAARLPRAGIVHRLDKDTSGLMVVGKTLETVTALVRAIAAREVHRHYRALAWGEVPAARHCIDAPIGRDPRSRVRMAVVAGGRVARTWVERTAYGQGISALECTLDTGRTHQIRVHLASRGHPLVADAVYGGEAVDGLARQALHAHRLSFAHPVTGRALDLRSAPPADFAALWRSVHGPG